MSIRKGSNDPLVELNDLVINFYKSRGLFKKTQALNALHNINLTIEEGEIVVVVGESGSGKTTLANVVAGLLEPTSGSFKFKGKEISSMSKQEMDTYRSSVQIIQQDSYAALNPMRTMVKSLGDPMIIKNYATKSNVLEKVNEILEAVDLTPTEHFINKYPHQMSGGQRQRALIARALSMRPELILADEPVSMIDVSLRVSILSLLSNLNKEHNIAILYITHDLATARYIGHDGRIAIMYLGEIVEMGNLREVLSNPRHPYSQALLTAVPMPDPRLSRMRKDLELNATEPPDIANMPSGCRFHTRCIYCKEICKTKIPEPQKRDGSIVSCHLVDEIPKFELFAKDANV